MSEPKSGKLERRTRSEAKPKEQKDPSPKFPGMGPGTWAILSVLKLLSILIERFGWPGTILLLGAAVLHSWATADQKREIIDTYVLFHGVDRVLPVIAIVVLAIAVAAAQAYRYNRNEDVLKKQVDQLQNDLELERARKASSKRK